MVLTEKQKRETAYHESGHAVVAQICEFSDPVHKVTIIPRGRALGVTYTLPTEDQYTLHEQQLLDRICHALGGRVAEEIFLGRIGSGAADDIKRVTSLARTMVTRLGMSEKLGPVAYEESTEQVFLGRDYSRRQLHSEKTLQEIDAEVSRIIGEQLLRARDILNQHAEKVEIMAAALLERETLDKEEVELIMQGKPLPEPGLPLGLEPNPPSGSAPRDEGEQEAEGDGESATVSLDDESLATDPADDASLAEEGPQGRGSTS
jgi:cell division protease FtsH